MFAEAIEFNISGPYTFGSEPTSVKQSPLCLSGMCGLCHTHAPWGAATNTHARLGQPPFANIIRPLAVAGLQVAEVGPARLLPGRLACNAPLPLPLPLSLPLLTWPVVWAAGASTFSCAISWTWVSRTAHPSPPPTRASERLYALAVAPTTLATLTRV